MDVMTTHNFFDDDVTKVTNDGHPNNREIVLSENNEGALLLNKEDVIALAKEFGLIVFDKTSQL